MEFVDIPEQRYVEGASGMSCQTARTSDSALLFTMIQQLRLGDKSDNVERSLDIRSFLMGGLVLSSDFEAI